MKFLIIILILLAFIQTTVVPLDLVLIVLLLQSYIKPDRLNLILAVCFGFLIAHLTNQSMIYPLVYLILVELTHFLTKLPVRKNLGFLILSLSGFLFLEKIVLVKLGFGPDLKLIIFEIILSLPTFFILRFFQERFIIKDIKLRI